MTLEVTSLRFTAPPVDSRLVRLYNCCETNASERDDSDRTQEKGEWMNGNHRTGRTKVQSPQSCNPSAQPPHGFGGAQDQSPEDVSIAKGLVKFLPKGHTIVQALVPS